jgi:hypothetical protein
MRQSRSRVSLALYPGYDGLALYPGCSFTTAAP